MTFEEMMLKAENGDVDAMLEVADHLREGGSFEGIEGALHWYEKAAAEGDYVGTLQSMLCNEVIALVNEEVGDFTSAIEAWSKVGRYAEEMQENYELLISEYTSSDEQYNLLCEDNKMTKESASKFKYGIACCLWGLGKYNEAIDKSKGLADISAKVLHGTCIIKTNGRVEDAVSLLKNIESAQYQGKDKCKVEQHIYAYASIYLSGIYRMGLTGQPTDMNSAINTLNSALNSITHEDIKNIIRKESNKYQKKLFGGYKYIG